MSKLSKTLAIYDDWHVPHLGEPRSLSSHQREENHAFVMQHKDARIATLRSAIPMLAEAIDDLLNPQADLVRPIQTIEKWWLESLIKVNLIPPVTSFSRRLLTPKAYLAKNEAMAEAHWDERHDHKLVPKLASLLDDLALALGEAVVLRRPDFEWALNHLAEEEREDAIEWGHTCILRPSVGDWPAKTFAMMDLTRKSYGMLFANERARINRPAHQVNGEWFGPFFGWMIIAIVDGGYTRDFYPDGPAGERVEGHRHHPDTPMMRAPPAK